MLNNKVKSMTFSEYIQVVKNEYVTVQIIPSKSSRNNKTDTVAQIINKMHLKLDKLIRIEDKKLVIQQQMKASYYIHITSEEVKFYFIIPKVHYMRFKSKLNELWKNIDMNEVEGLPIDINSCTKYQQRYKMKDILSLDVDKRNNDLLNANMSVLDVIRDEEYVGILYNFIPTSEKQSNYFKKKSRSHIAEYRKGNNLKRNKNGIDFCLISLKWVLDLVDDILSSLSSGSNKSSSKHKSFNKDRAESSLYSMYKDTCNSTKAKLRKDICRSQILVLSKSENKERERELGIVASNTFKSISSDDNELIPKEVKKNIDPYKPVLNGVDILYTSNDEVSNFIASPARELIEEYREIEHKPIIENPVPKCLQDGEMFIGLVNYKEQVYKAFFSMHKEFKNLERVLIGSKGSGKSHKMVNMAKNAIKLGNGVVVIDIIEDCKVSKAIAEATPKDKLVRIRCNNIDEIQGYVYNEVPINESMTPYEIFSNAVKRTQLLQTFFDAVNDDSSQLSPRMIKYLFAAGSVVYSAKHNASLNDVLECLEYPNIRYNFINSLSDELKKLLERRIKKLSELDQLDKDGSVVGNKDNKIDGILDRAALLDSMSAHLEVALNKYADENINFVEAIRENKVILIEIPEQEFPSTMLRNIMATFFLSKVWAAKQILQSEDYQPTTELFFDEFYKCPNCQLLFETIFAEARKYRLITTVALHNLGQLSPKCRMTLRSGGASYMLLSGADVEAYRELRSSFENLGYDEKAFSDIKKPYRALCLIKNEDENYSAFIADFPKDQ